MQSLFSDRISKREAHLRWAAEVTQTVGVRKVEELPAASWRTPDGSVVTFNSEVQASQPGRYAPRPAAGLRTQTPGGSSWPRPPGDAGGEDPTRKARPLAGGAVPRRSPSSFEDDFDDFDDAHDTIVSDSKPNLLPEDCPPRLRRRRPCLPRPGCRRPGRCPPSWSCRPMPRCRQKAIPPPARAPRRGPSWPVRSPRLDRACRPRSERRRDPCRQPRRPTTRRTCNVCSPLRFAWSSAR